MGRFEVSGGQNRAAKPTQAQMKPGIAMNSSKVSHSFKQSQASHQDDSDEESDMHSRSEDIECMVSECPELGKRFRLRQIADIIEHPACEVIDALFGLFRLFKRIASFDFVFDFG